MEYSESPSEYHPGGRPAVFLAGDISGCPDWQAEAAGLFGDDPVTGTAPELVLCSTAARCRATWKQTAAELSKRPRPTR
ncbi:hypothetical protein ACFYNO_35935 [Kitasatospora sp. NPDC006697]|uniref:hypothetical protein n=1 Tax=Kitasatospora sp. NPDC006697 TaxID=3364020 RepID=UPI0036BA8CDC